MATTNVGSGDYEYLKILIEEERFKEAQKYAENKGIKRASFVGYTMGEIPKTNLDKVFGGKIILRKGSINIEL